MAPPVRLLPSAGSLTSHEAPVLVTDNAEPSPYLTSIAGKASGTAVPASISEEKKELVSEVKNDIGITE